MQYRGRFAPSPTGPLHMGSLLAALGSYLQAKIYKGEWLLRIEDLDPPREVPGAGDDILHTLEKFGFEWDSEIMYQSRRLDLYFSILKQLENQGSTYPCTCSRTEIASMCRHGTTGLVYPGTCRKGIHNGRSARAIRVLTPDNTVSFIDGLQGQFQQNLFHEVGDFVLKRADGPFAYQLAVVVDDAALGITEIVRGSDLLDSTPRQIYLQQLLGYPTPRYIHLPVLINDHGEKLSKQTHARPINPAQPVPDLVQAMRYLGHYAPAGLMKANLKDFWSWAIENWNLEQVVKSQTIREDDFLDR